MIAALLFVLCAPLQAQTPQAIVESVMARAETLVAAQTGKDAREVEALAQKAQSLAQELKPLGWRAVAALAVAAKDLKRPMKVRLLAASYLALTEDPSALPPLADILLNPAQAPPVRALAAQSLSGLGAPDPAVSRSLCKALAQNDLPREVLFETLIPIARLGCANPAALERVARSFGPRPGEKDLILVSASCAALGRSRGAASVRALLSLISYFPPKLAPRAAAIKALETRGDEAGTWHKPDALPVVVEALRSESERHDTMIPLIHLGAALGRDAAPALARLSRHPDPEVLAEAAEALAALKHVAALPALESVVKGAMSDPRYSPRDGRPDPAVSLARLEKAVETLRRAR